MISGVDLRPTLLALFTATLCGVSQLHAQVRLTYLGTAGWEISDGQTIVLIDPYLSRLRRVIPNDDTLPGDPRPLFTNADTARSDTAVIARHISRADYILITHTHYDHILDVPYIARKTGATIIGTESSHNFLRASGVASDKIVVVRGGEDYALGQISVRVLPSLHGVLRRAPNVRAPSPFLPSAVFPANATAPFLMNDLRLEGGTLAYLVRIGGRQLSPSGQ